MKVGKPATGDGRPRILHEPQRVGEIVDGDQAVNAEFACIEEMAQVGARVRRTGQAWAPFLQREFRETMFGSLQVEIAVRGQYPSVPGQPGRPNTVEEVDTTRHRVEYTF